MEGQIHSESKQNITLNLDEFDIDSYDFKPVTKGLGFHEPKKKKEKFPTQQSRVNTKPKETRVLSSTVSHQMPKKDYLQSTPLSVSDPSLMSGIEALYAKEEKQASPKKEDKPKVQVEKRVILAKKETLLAAFLLDLCLVVVLTSVLILSFFGIAMGELNKALLEGFVFSSLPYIGTLAALIFITYFSLTEPVGTFGKKALGISTYRASSLKRATIRQSFIRSTITLFSFFLLGLPTLLDFQGKLSETRVIKK